jgi:hypothetical protein
VPDPGSFLGFLRGNETSFLSCYYYYYYYDYFYYYYYYYYYYNYY